MIISDLNHFEVLDQSANVVGGFTSDGYASNSYYENFDVNKYLSSDVSVYGHLATAESDATASGPGSATQIFTNTNTTPYSSSSSGTSISASSGYFFYY
jgi:hypothetical protein